MQPDPLISIIIPTKNEAKNIKRCINSIKENTYKNSEVIVVDQSSTDDTQEISKNLGAIVINVPPSTKYVPPSNSRNIGFGHSKGEYIYHIDADMELEPNLLVEIVDIFKDKNISAIVVPEKDVPLNIWAKAKAFERSLYAGTNMEAARVSRRELFEKVAYDKKILSGEDWNIHEEFEKRGGITRTKSYVKHHIGSISLEREFKKKLHYGTGSVEYVSSKKKRLTDTLFNLLYLYSRGILSTIFKDPLVVFAFIIVRFVDTLGLFIGLIQSGIQRSSQIN